MLLGLLAPTPGEVESLLLKGFNGREVCDVTGFVVRGFESANTNSPPNL